LYFAEPQLAGDLSPQPIFGDFTGDGHRKAGDEPHIARDLVPGNPAAAEILNVLLGRLLAGSQDDARADLLAIPGVRHPHALASLDFRVAVEGFLDPPRLDGPAAADNHVLHTTDDVAVVQNGDGGEVPGMYPHGGVDRFARAHCDGPTTDHHGVPAR